MFPVSKASPPRRCILVECPKRGDGQDWDGSHLLGLLPKCDILIAMLALADEVIETTSPSGQTRSFGDIGSMSGLLESGHGGVIYEYTP